MSLLYTHARLYLLSISNTYIYGTRYSKTTIPDTDRENLKPKGYAYASALPFSLSIRRNCR